MRRPESDPSPGVGFSPNPPQKTPNTAPQEPDSIGLYAKCLSCPDYGVTCNGPKLAALGDIMVVREFHRAIRDRRQIPMRLIHEAADSISEYTVNDYFSHSVKDFKWTTVGAIDNALTAICGNRIGQPLLDHPCPASSTEIRQQSADVFAALQEARAECARLRDELETAQQKRRHQRAEIKEEDQRKIDHLKNQVAYLEQRCDYLKDTAEKRYRLIVNRDWIIIVLAAVCVVLLILSVMYLSWDFTHDGAGIFW